MPSIWYLYWFSIDNRLEDLKEKYNLEVKERKKLETELKVLQVKVSFITFVSLYISLQLINLSSFSWRISLQLLSVTRTLWLAKLAPLFSHGSRIRPTAGRLRMQWKRLWRGEGHPCGTFIKRLPLNPVNAWALCRVLLDLISRWSS